MYLYIYLFYFVFLLCWTTPPSAGTSSGIILRYMHIYICIYGHTYKTENRQLNFETERTCVSAYAYVFCVCICMRIRTFIYPWTQQFLWTIHSYTKELICPSHILDACVSTCIYSRKSSQTHVLNPHLHEALGSGVSNRYIHAHIHNIQYIQIAVTAKPVPVSTSTQILSTATRKR